MFSFFCTPKVIHPLLTTGLTPIMVLGILNYKICSMIPASGARLSCTSRTRKVHILQNENMCFKYFNSGHGLFIVSKLIPFIMSPFLLSQMGWGASECCCINAACLYLSVIAFLTILCISHTLFFHTVSPLLFGNTVQKTIYQTLRHFIIF